MPEWLCTLHNHPRGNAALRAGSHRGVRERVLDEPVDLGGGPVGP